MNKLTDWFPAGSRPARKGVYNTRSNWGGAPPEGGYQYWNGKRFMCTCDDPAMAYRFRTSRSSYPLAEWRGLASDPSVTP